VTLREPEVPRTPDELAYRDAELDVFSHIEGLIGEELDRIFERLHLRARHLAHRARADGQG
jgi:hypothetical protein